MIRLNSEYHTIKPHPAKASAYFWTQSRGRCDLILISLSNNLDTNIPQILINYEFDCTISSKDLVPNGFNNQFKYSFPASATFKDVEVAVQSISMYNSQFNIDSVAYGNNTFKVEVLTAATVLVISITLKDGIYSYTDINRMIQTARINAGAYLIDSNGNNVFFIQLIENSTYYAAQVDVYPTPTVIGSYTAPPTGVYSSGGSGLPTTARVPRLIIDNSKFGEVIGYSSGQYPSSSSTVAASFLSDLSPQVNPVSAYVVRFSLINNSFTAPPDILTVQRSQSPH
ncbi:unnamed protein product [Phytophthora fragariaefolia]|uniref:Unnamed protein product n=1 Tax=Phytophthora fragariaefolia TaxID=1490495 RepID=A0A9W7CMI7_9STRA|nr:unnamed protein product [Phytophthora fragariaefolia]